MSKNIAANADVKGEFKIWYEPSEKTVYYWTSTKYAYLNENSEKMFDGFSNLESIDTTQLNASFAATTANMFSKNPKLKTLNFGKYIFNTEKVTDMHEMFADTGLEEIPVNNYVGPSFFDTKNVVNMSGMFARTRQLKDIRFAEFIDLRNAEDLSYMFYGLNGSKSYYIGTAFGSKTKKVKKLDYIFAIDQENKVKQIDVEYWGNLDERIWDTSSVESYEGMFAGRTNYGGCGDETRNSVPVSDLAWLRPEEYYHRGYFCAFDHL